MAASRIDKGAADFGYRVVNEAAGKKRYIKAIVEVQGFNIGMNPRRAVRQRREHVWGVVHRRDTRAPFKEPTRQTAGSAAKLEDPRASVKQGPVILQLAEVRRLAIQIDGAAVWRLHSGTRAREPKAHMGADYTLKPCSRNQRAAPGCKGTSRGVASVSSPSAPMPW